MSLPIDTSLPEALIVTIGCGVWFITQPALYESAVKRLVSLPVAHTVGALYCDEAFLGLIDCLPSSPLGPRFQLLFVLRNHVHLVVEVAVILGVCAVRLESRNFSVVSPAAVAAAAAAVAAAATATTAVAAAVSVVAAAAAAAAAASSTMSGTGGT